MDGSSKSRHQILVDTQAAAAAVQRAPATIRSWAHQGLIRGQGQDNGRRVLYDLADIYKTATMVTVKRKTGPLT